MDGYFNIVLFPDNANLIASFIDLAQANLKDQAEDYLLGEQAYPHITLCQFRSEQLQSGELANIWDQIKDLYNKPLMLYFHYIYILAGEKQHIGKYWLGLSVKPTEQLINVQQKVYDKLISCGIESDSKPDGYFPHITWGLLNGLKPITISQYPPEAMWVNEHAFCLALGHSDKNGVFTKRVY